MCSYWATYEPRMSQSGGKAFTNPASQSCLRAPMYFSCVTKSKSKPNGMVKIKRRLLVVKYVVPTSLRWSSEWT